MTGDQSFVETQFKGIGRRIIAELKVIGRYVDAINGLSFFGECCIFRKWRVGWYT